MKFIKIDPPGTFCHYEALMEMIQKTDAKRFLEVGCGAGDLSLKLCKKGLTGAGIDFSEQALEQANTNLKTYIDNGQYHLISGDIMTLEPEEDQLYDLALSMMVMEHVEDDIGFTRRIAQFVKPGGFVIFAVPGRRDRWSIEDETVGHLRRYDQDDLEETLKKSGLESVDSEN